MIKASRELEGRLTEPDKKLGFTPRHAYTLRGVINSVDVLFICLPAEQDLMQIDEADSSTKAADRWWKLGYVAADDEPIKAEVTTFEKVMEEACGIGSKPILIYASNKAMAEEPIPLSDALQVSNDISEYHPVQNDTDKYPDLRPLRQPSVQERISRRGSPRQEARGIYVARVPIQAVEPV